MKQEFEETSLSQITTKMPKKRFNASSDADEAAAALSSWIN